MHETGKKLLNLMFRPGEEICVSHNKYAYHSLPLRLALLNEVTLAPPNADKPCERVPTDNLIFAALNPIKGNREDENCTAFRNFLVEIDASTREEQIAYIKKSGLPYSAMVWSGSKSTHTLISLDTDLPSENLYRLFSEWMLKICAVADQKTKNPSRCIRLPGATRPETGRPQELIEFKGPVKITELVEFLKRHPGAKPVEQEKKPLRKDFSYNAIAEWVVEALQNGIDASRGRNSQWFAIACEFALSGYSEGDTIEILGKHFTSERDFKEREWLTTIRSAFKHTYNERD